MRLFWFLSVVYKATCKARERCLLIGYKTAMIQLRLFGAFISIEKQDKAPSFNYLLFPIFTVPSLLRDTTRVKNLHLVINILLKTSISLVILIYSSTIVDFIGYILHKISLKILRFHWKRAKMKKEWSKQ